MLELSKNKLACVNTKMEVGTATAQILQKQLTVLIAAMEKVAAIENVRICKELKKRLRKSMGTELNGKLLIEEDDNLQCYLLKLKVVQFLLKWTHTINF